MTHFMKPLVLRNFPACVQHEGYDGLIDMFIFELTDNKWQSMANGLFYDSLRTALNMVLTCVRSHRSSDDFPTAFVEAMSQPMCTCMYHAPRT